MLFVNTDTRGTVGTFYNENPTLANKLKEILKHVVEIMKRIYAKLNPQSYEGRFIAKSDIAMLEEAYKRYITGIRNATANLQNTENTATEGGVRFSGRDSRYDFSLERDLNTLDDKALKVYNKRGWAYTLFTNEDKRLLFEKIDEYSQLKTRNKDNILPDGSMITDVNNKMVLISGTRNSPIINAVLVINSATESYAEIIKDDIYDDTKEIGLHASQCSNYLSYCENWYGAQSVKFYGAEDYYHIKGRQQERAKTPDGWDYFGYVRDYEIGRRLREEAEQAGGVRFSDDRSFDFSDFGSDDLFDVDDTIEDIVEKEYVTHSEDIGEVLSNIAATEISQSHGKAQLKKLIIHAASAFMQAPREFSKAGATAYYTSAMHGRNERRRQAAGSGKN